jgi:hypothetical protein
MALKGGVCYVASHSIAGFISVWSRDSQADVSYHTPSTQLALLTAWNGMEWNGIHVQPQPTSYAIGFISTAITSLIPVISMLLLLLPTA